MNADLIRSPYESKSKERKKLLDQHTNVLLPKVCFQSLNSLKHLTVDLFSSLNLSVC